MRNRLARGAKGKLCPEIFSPGPLIAATNRSLILQGCLLLADHGGSSVKIQFSVAIPRYSRICGRSVRQTTFSLVLSQNCESGVNLLFGARQE
jgi:hypothetical protein